jgi:hypothetical protein
MLEKYNKDMRIRSETDDSTTNTGQRQVLIDEHFLLSTLAYGASSGQDVNSTSSLFTSHIGGWLRR